MPTAYVYSPVGGIITGRLNYCTGCNGSGDANCNGSGNTHQACGSGWIGTIDIDADNGEDIYLYVNYPTVKTIRTLVLYDCCYDASNDYGRAVIVELYSEAGCYIGSVKYGHIANVAVSNNVYYTLSSSSKKIGTSPSGSYSDCYSGSHVHMERTGGSTQAPCCCTDTTKGTTTIYSWAFNSSC